MSKAEKIIIALLFFPSPILFCMLVAAVFIFVCCLSGFLAIIGGLVRSEFEIGAVSFNFTVTIIITLTLAGGFILALLQYWLTKAATATTLRFMNRLNRYDEQLYTTGK